MDKNVFCTCGPFYAHPGKNGGGRRARNPRESERGGGEEDLNRRTSCRAFRRLSVLSTETDLKEWREAWKADKAMIHAGYLGTKSLGDVALTPP